MVSSRPTSRHLDNKLSQLRCLSYSYYFIIITLTSSVHSCNALIRGLPNQVIEYEDKGKQSIRFGFVSWMKDVVLRDDTLHQIELNDDSENEVNNAYIEFKHEILLDDDEIGDSFKNEAPDETMALMQYYDFSTDLNSGIHSQKERDLAAEQQFQQVSNAPKLSSQVTLRKRQRTKAKSTKLQLFDAETVLSGNQRMYGAFFDVTNMSKSFAINVRTLSLNLFIPRGKGNATIRVYTKAGTFLTGYQDSTKWTKVNHQRASSRGYGHATSLAKVRFHTVVIQPGETQAFYVSMPTPSLVLSRNGLTTGDTAATSIGDDRNVEIKMGAGLASPLTFDSGNGVNLVSLAWNLLWNGIVHYEVNSKALVPSSLGGLNTASAGVKQLLSGIGANTLFSTLKGGNGAVGAMFDVNAKSSAIIIRSLAIHTAIKTSERRVVVEVYSKQGSFVGFEKEPDEWTNVFTAMVQGKGRGSLTYLPTTDFTSVYIAADTTQAFYVTLTTKHLIYTNGDGLSRNKIFTGNDDLDITEGAGVGIYKFGQIYSPRVFNGEINYELDKNNADASDDNAVSKVAGKLLTTMEGGNGSYGVMFDCVPIEDVVVDGFNLHVALTTTYYVEIWTKYGTHLDHEGNFTAWTNVLPPGTPMDGQGLNMISPVPVGDFEPVPIKAGETQAFYITLTTPALRYTNSQDEVGKLYRNDFDSGGVMQVAAGIGVGTYRFAKFFQKRNFNGEILYRHEPKPTNTQTTTQSPPIMDTQACPSVVSSLSSNRPNTGYPSLKIEASTSQISTSFGGVNGSYGSMFDIYVHAQAVVLESISFHTRSTSIVMVEVYTRSDTYVGYEDTPGAWTRIVLANIRGLGQGQATKLDSHLMLPVYIPPNSVQGFYITLSNDDIRYSNVDFSKGTSGTGCVATRSTDNNIDLFVGVGVGSYPFGARLFPNRLFDGKLSFSNVVE